MPDITPLSNLERRLPLAGKIRLGKKGDRGQPQKLSTFRFTSHDRAAISRLAQLYGGTAAEWTGAPTEAQWEVVTDVDTIPVALPPGALYGPFYEMWSKGGLLRRCDGNVCTTLVSAGPDGREDGEVPCICAGKSLLECKQKLRVSLVLRDVRFAGVWMLESSGWNALHEIPGMVDMIQAMQSRGLTTARLTLAKRKQVKDGKTRNFVVPELSVDTTIDELASGAAGLGAGNAQLVDRAPVMGISGGGDPALALPAADPYANSEPDPEPEPDDQIVDAEIIEENHMDPEAEPSSPLPLPMTIDEGTETLMRSLANDHRIDPEVFIDALVRWADNDPERLAAGLQGLRTGGAIWRGIDNDGAARINKIKRPA
jgi:hypothetical protein